MAVYELLHLFLSIIVGSNHLLKKKSLSREYADSGYVTLGKLPILLGPKGQIKNSFLVHNWVHVICPFSIFVFLSEETIPDDFYWLFMNQTYLLQRIFNYTTVIPNLQLLIQGINASLQLEQAQKQQDSNATQNCTNAQARAQEPMAQACPLGIQAPGKEGPRCELHLKQNIAIITLLEKKIDPFHVIPKPFFAVIYSYIRSENQTVALIMSTWPL